MTSCILTPRPQALAEERLQDRQVGYEVEMGRER